MRTERHYITDIAPASTQLEIRLTDDRRHTAVLRYTVFGEPNESGDIIAHEVANPAPVPARYDAIVEAVIALRYTTGAEIALNRKPDDDPEKIDYLDFVQAAKDAAEAALTNPEP